MTSALLTPTRPVPVMRLDDTDPELFDQMMEAVRRVASSGAFTLGAEVEGFEREFAAYCETAHAVGLSSGTEALVLALRALEIGPGDEVIVPANSFIATAEAVSLVGAEPRLVDVDPILAVARAAGLRVVEDAAQAHGARLRGRRVGTFGDIGCFSFYPTKNLGAWGDGGAVVTADAVLADRMRLLRCHGERPRYHHRMVGTTARLDALQAAVLRLKLARLDTVTDERRRLGATLREGLAGTSLELPQPPCDAADHVYHLFVARSRQRESLREHLGRLGVNTAVHYPVPIHRVEAYAHLRMGPGSLPVSERLAERIVTLPLFPGMTDREVRRVIDAVRTFGA